MQSKGWIMLRVLLNRFHQKAPENLLKFLPEEDAKGVSSQKITSDNVAVALAQPQDRLEKIHYSWLISPLSTLPQSIQEPILDVLQDSDKLRQLLNKPQAKATVNLAPPVQTFLINTLYSKMKDRDVLPLEYLPATSLTPLQSLNKHQLIELMDLLGIYDLAEEVRNIIDKDRLKKIYTCLRPKQRQFLRTCLHQKERIAATRINLDHWHGDCKQLDNLLHSRGMIRLAKALCGQHPDFMWHLTHILDTGRGSRLLTHYTDKEVPTVTSVLTQQVLNLLNFLSPRA